MPEEVRRDHGVGPSEGGDHLPPGARVVKQAMHQQDSRTGAGHPVHNPMAVQQHLVARGAPNSKRSPSEFTVAASRPCGKSCCERRRAKGGAGHQHPGAVERSQQRVRPRDAEHGDETGDADDRPDLTEAAGDCGPRGEPARREIDDRGAGQARERQTDRGTRHELRGQPVTEVVGFGTCGAIDEARAAEQRQRGRSHRARAEPLDQPPTRCGRASSQERRRGDGESSLQQRVVPHLGEEQDVAEQQRVKADREHEERSVCDAERADP